MIYNPLPPKSGLIAFIFLVLGYQTALFVHGASMTKLALNIDRPDTVRLIDRQVVDSFLTAQSKETIELALLNSTEEIVFRQTSQHPQTKTRKKKQVESFYFNPNTVSAEDLCRLGFSEKQAQSIISYREKGGRFRRKTDFANSFVVADTVYRRLEAYIRIPKIDINRADTTELITLPGIGAWYAKAIIEYRQKLCGYSYPEQLKDIWKFTDEKYDNLSDLIVCGDCPPYPLWELPEEELAKHPYIKWAAHGITIYRKYHTKEELTVDGLIKNNVIKEEYGNKLKRCRIKEP